MTLEQIQEAIKGLGRERQKELLRWLADWDDWDQQMYEDIKDGRLDPLLEQASRDIAAGRSKSLPGDPDAPGRDPRMTDTSSNPRA